MDWVKDVIRSFGKHIGVEGLGFNNRGVCVLREEGDITIAIEDRDEVLLVYVSCPCPFISEEVMENALRSTHYRATRAIPVGVCLTKNGYLTFFSHINRSSVTLPRLNETIQILYRLMNSLVGKERR
jgi:type III secretion system chaperone SycN